MKRQSPARRGGGPAAENSRYPVCDRLRPSLEKNGQQWMLELVRWYEADWLLALEERREPSADAVLALIDPVRQEEIRTLLKLVETQYAAASRERLAQSAEPTIDVTPESGTGEALPGNESPQLVREKSLAADQPTSPLHRGGGVQSDHADKDDNLDETIESAGSSTSQEPTHQWHPVDPGGDLETSRIAATIESGNEPAGGQTAVDAPDMAARAIPGYRIKGVLGRGGMGVVYLAEQEGIDRLVALKMILSGGHADPMMLDRFQAEARAIGRFQHENIVRILDSGSHQGMPYFSLEYIDGKTLSAHLDGKPMEPREAATLLEPMARAMKYAHEAGVIHRDLKPGNVLMTTDGVPKITDFGLAKELEANEEFSMTGAIVGTPAFMAPEQARGERNLGPSTDVYGLGAVLYCMLTGRPPFQGAKATDTILQVIHNEPVDPTKLQPGIPKDLETICLKCLQKDPAQRYPSAAELADDLGCFSRGEPISARPIGRPERVWRWCNRNPTLAVASGLAAAMAITLMIGGPISAAMIWSEKNRVVEAKRLADANAEEAEQNAREARANAVAARENERRANEAKTLALENAKAAAVQEGNAIDALKALTFNVQLRMTGRADLVTLRQTLLDVVRQGLSRMEKAGYTVRDESWISAAIHSRLGQINMEIGQPEKARDEFEKCLVILDALHKKDELVNAFANLSKIHRLLGDATRALGQMEEAREHYLDSVEVVRQWEKEDSSVLPKTTLAELFRRLGSTAQSQGDLQAAHEFTEEATTLYENLYNSGNDWTWVEYQGARLLLAKVKFQQGRVKEGISLMSDAAEQMRDSATRSPGSDRAQRNKASFETELAVMLLYSGEIEQAKSRFNDTVAWLESQLQLKPNDLWTHRKLEESLYGLAVAYETSGQQKLARESLQRSIELREQSLEREPANVPNQLRLFVALARGGELIDALQLAEKLNAAIGDDDSQQYDLACGYALLARARGGLEESETADHLPSQEQLAEKSLALLVKAVEGGFSRSTDLRLDPDLEAVRSHPDFVQLLALPPTL